MTEAPTREVEGAPTATAPRGSGGIGRYDRTVRRLLRIPSGPSAATDADAYRLFHASLAISALRCLLTYVLFPVVAPIAGLTLGSRPSVGILLASAAIIFDVRAVRRFWLVNHSWRWPVTALYMVVIAFMSLFLLTDISRVA